MCEVALLTMCATTHVEISSIEIFQKHYMCGQKWRTVHYVPGRGGTRSALGTERRSCRRLGRWSSTGWAWAWPGGAASRPHRAPTRSSWWTGPATRTSAPCTAWQTCGAAARRFATTEEERVTIRLNSYLNGLGGIFGLWYFDLIAL